MSDASGQMTEEGLLAISQYQRSIIGGDDRDAVAALLHPNFIFNGPNNRCGTRDQILRLSEGAFAHGRSQWNIECTSVTDNVGILIGNEVVAPSETSLLAGWFGTKPIRRRFTEIYLFEEGRWLFLACQVSVIQEADEFIA